MHRIVYRARILAVETANWKLVEDPRRTELEFKLVVLNQRWRRYRRKCGGTGSSKGTGCESGWNYVFFVCFEEKVADLGVRTRTSVTRDRAIVISCSDLFLLGSNYLIIQFIIFLFNSFEQICKANCSKTKF